jgi:transcription initiation factor TFIID TATA-box-binding protein
MMLGELAIKIENVVASGALKHKIDLNAVIKVFPEAEYRPKKFPGVILRVKQPSATFLIFGSGKIVCVGARSEREAEIALRKLIHRLEDEGVLIAGEPEIQIKNVVASANLGGSVDLLRLYESTREMRGRVMYEPDQFPGLIYRMARPKAVLLIYSNGRLVCVGARREKDVHDAILKIHQELETKKLIYHG